MFWKCIPDTQFEKQIQEKNKSLKCPGCQSNDCTTGQEEKVCLTPTGKAESRDARSSLEQLNVNLVNSTRACLCLISPAFTEELGLRNLVGKKSLPNFNRTKNDQLRTWQRRSRDGSWRKIKWVTGMGKTSRECVGETRAWFADPLSRHCSKDMFSVRERKILERVVVHECSSSQWSTCLKLTEKMDSQWSLEGEPICIRGDALIRLVKTQQNTSIVYQNSMLYILWTFICHLYDIK